MQYVSPDWNKTLDYKKTVVEYNLDLYNLRSSIILGHPPRVDKYYTHVILAGYERLVFEFLSQNRLPVKGIKEINISETLDRPIWGYCRYINRNGDNTYHMGVLVVCVGVDSRKNPLDSRILDDNYARIIASIP